MNDAISSQVLADGTVPSTSPDGERDLFGAAPAPANRSALPAKGPAKKTSVTFGLTSSGSSASAALSLALASKLQAVTHLLGSTMFALTWKGQRTPSGRWLPRLRATALRTSGTGFTGWPTTQTTDAASAARHTTTTGIMHGGTSLTNAARMATWATPKAEDAESAGMRHSRGVADTLTAQSSLSSWATPSARDHKDSSDPATWNCTEERDRMDQLPRQAFGAMPKGFPAETEKPGQLNPALRRWLMGYPPEWDDCAASVTRSSLRKRPRSSAPSSR